MKTSIFTILIAVVISIGCSKDDAPENVVTGPNKYTYSGSTFEIIDAEYLYADGDTYLFFRGAGTANYVQIVFADNAGNIPTGTFTFNNDRYDPDYDPDSNFWSGGVTTDLNPLGYSLNGGTVTVLNKDGGNEVTFTVTTEEGTAQGSYTGTIRPR